jgi:hypothetical protein
MRNPTRDDRGGARPVLACRAHDGTHKIRRIPNAERDQRTKEDAAAQVEAAVLTAAEEQRHLGAMIESVDNYVGDLAFFWALVAIGR